MPRFHSTKEGFKDDFAPPAARGRVVSIPPRKVSRHEGERDREVGGSVVSIPLRKVSRAYPTKDAYEFYRCFHSTKEGFKVADAEIFRRDGLEFPFH